MIELLQKLPQNHQVIMSKDAEGNNFSPFANHSEDIYIPITTWYGEIKDKEEYEEENEEVPPNNTVVLWPVN